MSIATATPIAAEAEQRVLIRNVSWSTYESLVEEATGGRIAYDNGEMEIMSPSRSHEKIGRMIGRVVEAYTEELNIDIESVASTTFKREELLKGFEADESYYIQHAAEVRAKEELDLAVDPGPDLVIEVDISRSSMPKLPIYRALRVAEIWQYVGNELRIYVFEPDGYVTANSSRVLSDFPFAKLHELLGARATVSETELIRTFRAWLRERRNK